MKYLILVIMIISAAMLQGCQTTKSSVCKICHPEEAAQAEAAAPKENPIKKLDAWMQEHMW